MKKKTSDEQWLLNPKGIMSIAAKNDILASGSGVGHMMAWFWPLIPRTSRKQKGIFEYGRRTYGAPQQTKTIDCQLPRMRNSYIVTEEQEEFINAIDIAGDKIAVASGDYMARIFNSTTGEKVTDFWAMKPMHSVAISDKYCAYSSRDGCGIVAIPSMDVIESDQDFYGKYYLRNLAIKDEWLIGGSFGGITVFNIKNGDLIYDLKTGLDQRGMGSSQQNLAVNGDFIVGNGFQNQICAWNLKNGEQIGKFQGPPGYLDAVAIENEIVAAANLDGAVFVWNLNSGEKIAELESSLGYCNRLLIDKGKVGVASFILEIWNFDK